MRFLARIKRGSAVDKHWRGNRRAGGFIGAIPFRLVDNQYVSRELDESQVTAIRNNISVQLETAGVLPSAPVVEKQPVPPMEKPSRRKNGNGGITQEEG